MTSINLSTASISSNHVLAPCCSNNGLSEVDKESSKFLDLEDENEVSAEEVATLTGDLVDCIESRASEYGLMKIDESGRITQFVEKPKGSALRGMQVDTSVLGLFEQEAPRYPYIASMGVYVFRIDVLLKLLQLKYSSCNDFSSEIIPWAVKDHNVQVYLFSDYWEDIGTIKSFFDSNLALMEQPPKFDFNDPKTPFEFLRKPWEVLLLGQRVVLDSW